jgi:chitinase
VKPTVTFGINFNKSLLDINSCAVNLVADGYMIFYAEAKSGSGGSSFCYGINAGADLYATIDAPDAFL